MEYAWFNNGKVPGVGFPNDWENQENGRAAGSRKINGKLQPRMAQLRAMLLGKSSPTRICRASMITTSRLIMTTRICITRRRANISRSPVLRSLITGQRMDKITSGPNWEESSAASLKMRQRSELRQHAEGDVRPVRNTFMMYLLRACASTA